MDDMYITATGKIWYYNQETGLYYTNPELVGMGYDSDEVCELE
jgi:hypothetical protein